MSGRLSIKTTPFLENGRQVFRNISSYSEDVGDIIWPQHPLFCVDRLRSSRQLQLVLLP
jgi:hypothetical protein